MLAARLLAELSYLHVGGREDDVERPGASVEGGEGAQQHRLYVGLV